ncbi:MAG: SIS domain-containing protein, partial [Stellaceae bacterium]
MPAEAPYHQEGTGDLCELMSEFDATLEPPDLRQAIDPCGDLTVARRVIRAEIDGLERLAHGLEAAFGTALDVLAGVNGRVVVTGMGKSGHIGRKIASTLASTGTPAQFVHPAEASHGDLGMIGAGDVILALSNSGD